MSHFEFNPEQRNFPIYGAAERSYPVKEPIDYRLWIVELIYVYYIGKEMVLKEYIDKKPHRIPLMGCRERRAGTHLISWSRILPGTLMEANQARQNGREANWWMVSIWLLFGLGEGNQRSVYHYWLMNFFWVNWWSIIVLQKVEELHSTLADALWEDDILPLYSNL